MKNRHAAQTSCLLFLYFFRRVLRSYKTQFFGKRIISENVEDAKCIMVPYPAVLKWNEQKQLHSEDGPARAWKDGYALHFLHGLRMEKDLWQKIASRAMTPEEILSIKNQEVRHAAVRVYGYETITNACANVIAQDDRGQVVEVDLADDEARASNQPVLCFTAVKTLPPRTRVKRT